METILNLNPVAGGLLLAIGIFMLYILTQGRSAIRFRMKPLLTENEMEFFGRLLTALPDYHVFPQVAFRAIMSPYSRSSSKNYAKEFSSIGSKHCDYLICSRDTLRVIAIIELDDKTHVASKDKIRDSMTKSAGYKTIRFESRNKPSVQQIKTLFKGALE